MATKRTSGKRSKAAGSAASRARAAPDTGAREFLLRAAELQRAVAVTASAFAREYLELAAGYGDHVSSALLEAARAPESAKDIASGVLDEYRNYVGQLAALPRIYGIRLLAEIEQGRDR